MTAASQLLTAETIGLIAYEQGRKNFPAHDATLVEMVKGRKVGQTPEGEASTVAIFRAWSGAWHKANRAAAAHLLQPK